MKSVTELEKSLDMIADQGIIRCGDFNCPDIDWSSQSINHNCADIQVQQSITDFPAKYNLSQFHKTPTRRENLLDQHIITFEMLNKHTWNLRPRHHSTKMYQTL